MLILFLFSQAQYRKQRAKIAKTFLPFGFRQKYFLRITSYISWANQSSLSSSYRHWQINCMLWLAQMSANSPTVTCSDGTDVTNSLQVSNTASMSASKASVRFFRRVLGMQFSFQMVIIIVKHHNMSCLAWILSCFFTDLYITFEVFWSSNKMCCLYIQLQLSLDSLDLLNLSELKYEQQGSLEPFLRWFCSDLKDFRFSIIKCILKQLIRLLFFGLLLVLKELGKLDSLALAYTVFCLVGYFLKLFRWALKFLYKVPEHRGIWDSETCNKLFVLRRQTDIRNFGSSQSFQSASQGL